MASEASETIADIVAEMRAPHDEICEKCHEEPNESCPYCGDPDGCNSPDYGRWPGVMTQLADRIAAAARRDAAIHAMTCEANGRLREHLEIALEDDKRTVGNSAAMREALDGMMYEAFSLCDSGIPPAIERGKLLAKWCDRLRAAMMPNQFTSPTAGRAGSAETAEAKGSTSTGNTED